MKKLSNEDVLRNRVDTINQYKILQYLKKNINVSEFNLYLYNCNVIKVIDKNNEVGYFKFDENERDILFLDEL